MPGKLLCGICALKYMRLQIFSKQIVVSVIIFSGLTLLLSLLFYSIPQGLAQNGFTPIIEHTRAILNPEQEIPALPVRLKIPSINVNAYIEHVGLTPDGVMEVSKKRYNVFWFNLGSRPGENGSAVIAGHYGWKNSSVSAFDNLYKLRKGDRVYIEDNKGVTTSFVVRESRTYDLTADASNVFGSNDGKSHLNLITCEGVWDKVSKTYSKRLVIFTDKEF